MVKKVLLPIGLVACAASIGTAALQNVEFSHNLSIMRSAPSEYVLNLNSSNTPSGLTSSYQNNFSGSVTTSNGNTLSMSFVNAKQLSNGFVQLANHGKIYNFSTSNSAITAITGVELTGSGSLTFKPGILTSTGGILPDITPIAVSAGGGKVTVPTCDYFEIEAGDSGASITSLKLTYTCSESVYDVKMLNGTYTGLGTDEYIYKLTINNGSATFESVNKLSNVSYSGTASLSSKTSASLSLSSGSITYNMTYDGHGLTFVSKTGTIEQVNFERVYKVQDFESYTASGTGYVSADAKFTTTGLRSAFYADYYTGSSSGEIGGSGWPIMTSTDNMTFNSSKGHNSSKVGVFKFSNGSDMRYIAIDELYGVQNVRKGTTLSFWARGAYTGTSLSTDHSSNIPMKMYAYYATPLTPSNQTTARETFEFTVESGNEWQHFEMPLTAGRTYYGFGMYAKQSTGTTAYVPFDDFEIYTESPYAEYIDEGPADYPQGTFKGTFKKTSSGSTYNIVIAIGTYVNGLVHVMLNNVNDAQATGITFNDSTKQISITTSAKFDNTTIGTITGTYNPSTGVISSLKSSVFYSRGSYSATKVSAGSTFYNCDGTTSQLQSQFKRRYGDPWTVDTGNADRITSNEIQFASGTGALKLRSYTGGRYALNLNADLGSSVTITYLQFWVYNPSSTSVDLRAWVYTATGLGGNAEMTGGTHTAAANGWSYLTMYAVSGSNPASKTIYNFQIADFTKTGVALTFDNIYLY